MLCPYTRTDPRPFLPTSSWTDLFEWHFVVRGPSGTDFAGGLYHGRILVPPEYPFKPPSFMFLTPNGRFETNTKICLNISEFHPESWQPSWSVRTALLALVAFLPTPPDGGVGSADYPPAERRILAARSRTEPPLGFGNDERQAVTKAMHEAILEREAEEAAKSGGTSTAGTAEQAPQQAPPQQQPEAPRHQSAVERAPQEPSPQRVERSQESAETAEASETTAQASAGEAGAEVAEERQSLTEEEVRQALENPINRLGMAPEEAQRAPELERPLAEAGAPPQPRTNGVTVESLHAELEATEREEGSLRTLTHVLVVALLAILARRYLVAEAISFL